MLSFFLLSCSLNRLLFALLLSCSLTFFLCHTLALSVMLSCSHVPCLSWASGRDTADSGWSGPRCWRSCSCLPPALTSGPTSWSSPTYERRSSLMRECLTVLSAKKSLKRWQASDFISNSTTRTLNIRVQNAITSSELYSPFWNIFIPTKVPIIYDDIKWPTK